MMYILFNNEQLLIAKNTAAAVFFVFAFSPAEIDNAAPLCYAKRKILTEGDYAKKRENL